MILMHVHFLKTLPCLQSGRSSSQKDYVIMPRYFVLQKGSCYEIRLYDQHAAVSAAHDAGNGGDSLLRIQRYLDGENSEQQVFEASAARS